jgi:hypothetical protein
LLEGCGLTTPPRRLLPSLRYTYVFGRFDTGFDTCVNTRYNPRASSIPVVALATRTARGLRFLVAWIVGFWVNQDADAPFDDAR